MRTLLSAVLLLALAAAAPAQTGDKPISRSGLQKALEIGGLSTGEFVQIINERGVAFQLTDKIEAELRRLGADSALVEAVRANYRGVARATAAGPLSKEEILTLLQVGTPSSRIASLVQERGVSFPATQPVIEELVLAGAEESLVQAIRGESVEAPAARGSSSGPRPIPKLTEVKTVWVEPMEEGLDEELRLEIGRRLAGKMTIVLDRARADAILVGDAEVEEGGVGSALGISARSTGVVRLMDPGRRSIIWSAEAGDKSAFSTFRKGGPAKVAERLVKQLEKSIKKAEKR